MAVGSCLWQRYRDEGRGIVMKAERGRCLILVPKACYIHRSSLCPPPSVPRPACSRRQIPGSPTRTSRASCRTRAGSIGEHRIREVLSLIHSSLCILHSPLCTLHSPLCTLHSAFCFLHSAFWIVAPFRAKYGIRYKIKDLAVSKQPGLFAGSAVGGDPP
jgi:hypothetical protein